MPIKLKYTTAEMYQKLLQFNITLLGEYTGINVKTEMKCYCGNTFICTPHSICTQGTKSCGCSQQMKGNYIDIVGKTFGRLYVESIAPKTEDIRKFVCKCICGNTCLISGRSLRDGHTRSCGCLQKEYISMLGKSSRNPDLTDSDRTWRPWEFELWREEVYKKDNFTCQICGIIGGRLNAHHLNGWNWAIEQRYDINNGITLCETCHNNFHNKFGRGGNTEQQFIEFKLGVKE